VTATLAAAAAICRRDFLVFASYRTRFVSTAFATLVGVTLFYYVSRLVSAPQVGSADDYFGFVVLGMVILEVLTSTRTAPIATLRAELLTGTFERMVVSPFGPVAAIVSMTVFPLIVGLVTGVVTLAFASAVFGLHLRWSTAALGLPVAILGAAAFSAFGVAMAAGVMMFKQTNAGATFIVTGLTVVAGLYFPVTLLPGWIRWTSEVQPFTPAVDLLRNVLVGTPLRESAWLSVAKLVVFAGLALPLATLALSRAVRHSRRKGTITEY
jgi:ABC-2 type transport system permease protein